MNRKILAALSALALAGAAGCESGKREQPTLCVVSPIPDAAPADGWTQETLKCDVDATSEDEDDLRDCQITWSQDGQSFILVHRLPADVTPIGPLKVHVQTPCEGSDQDLEVTHVDGTAVLVGVVPPGGRHAFSLTATMANSELRCDFGPGDTGAGGAGGQAPTCPDE